MMPSRPFADFLSRAHSRRLAWRVVEYAGIATLFGCALAAVMIAILWWRGDEIVVPVVAILFIAAVAGIVAALRRAPSLLDTAMLADRALQAPDLLSSALMMIRSDSSPDGFRAAVLALADARVRDISPSRIVTHRLGRRGWTGVVLASAGVLTLAAMATNPASTSHGTALAAEHENLFSPRSSSDRAVASADASTSRSSESSPRSSGIQGNTPENPRDSLSNELGAADRSSLSNKSEVGSNGVDGTRSNSAPKTSTPPTANAADGAARGVADQNRSETSSALIAPPSRRIDAPPWTSSTWSQDRARAQQAVQNGAVPDRYRALVKDYFDSEDDR